MTKEEIIQKCNFEEYNSDGEKKTTFTYLKLYVKSIDKEIPFTIMNLPGLQSEPELTHVTKLLNEIINGEIECPTSLKEEIFKHYIETIDISVYGQIDYDKYETELSANKAYFKINTPEDAYKNLEIENVFIHSDLANKKLFQVDCKIPWDNEHGIIIYAKDLKFVELE